MGQYIDKDALVAELERLRKNQRLDDRHGQGVLDGLHAIERFIDSLEVKEVDLDGERRKYLTEHFNVYENGILQSKRSNLPLDTYDVIKIAKHFFELALSLKNN